MARSTAEPLPTHSLGSPKFYECLKQNYGWQGLERCDNDGNLQKTLEDFEIVRFPSRLSILARSSEIREIDLEGLKKILQRDPKDTRPLLINFWATWCDGCREEFPDLVKIDNDYRAKGLNFVSVSLDDILDIKTKVPDFLKQVKAEMPVVLLNVNDPEPAIHFVDPNWQGDMPATFLYDKDGKIVFKYFGAIKPAQLRGEIDRLMNSKQPAVSSGQ